MSDQTAKQWVETLAVHFTDGTTTRVNVVPGSVKVRLRNVTGTLLGIDYEPIPDEAEPVFIDPSQVVAAVIELFGSDYEPYPDEDRLVYIDPSQVIAVAIERWEHSTTSAKDGGRDE